jgi:hypothetical protein
MEQNGGCCLQLAASAEQVKNRWQLRLRKKQKTSSAVTNNPQFLQILQPISLLESQKVKILEGFPTGGPDRRLAFLEPRERRHPALP